MFHSHYVFEAGRIVFSKTGEKKNNPHTFPTNVRRKYNCNTSTQHRLRRYVESEDDSDMLREWEDLDGDIDKSPLVDIESLKVIRGCLPDMLRMIK